MTIGELLKCGADTLCGAGIENYSGEVRDIIMHLMGYSASELFMHSTDEADPAVSQKFSDMIRKRCTHYPLQYILGETCFMGYTFKCRENVLIPRYDTENLVAAAAESINSPDSLQVLDMCTGTGCIGISFYMERLKKGVRDKVTLADISDDAIAAATENRKLFGESCIEDVEIIKTDLFSGLGGRKYDVLLSNPPYIPTEECDKLETDVRDYEPRLALDGDIDGLSFYKRIISEMGEYLNDNSYIYMEIGYDQYEGVRKLMEDAGYDDISLIKDLNGLDRVVSCRKRINR